MILIVVISSAVIWLSNTASMPIIERTNTRNGVPNQPNPEQSDVESQKLANEVQKPASLSKSNNEKKTPTVSPDQVSLALLQLLGRSDTSFSGD